MYEVLRVIHVLAGIFLGGATLFELLILNPGLRRVGPAIQGPLMAALSPILGPAAGLLSITLLGTGIAITLMQRSLPSLFTTAWGWAIIVSIVAVLAFIVNGAFGLVPTGNRLTKLVKSISGRPPTPEERQQMQGLSTRIDKLQNLQFAFVLIALATMIMIRFL